MDYPVDLEQFWADDEAAHRENCFSQNAPQAALGLRMSEECVFAELGEEGEPWGVLPRARRLALNKRYNDKAEQIVGRRLLPEALPPEDAALPPIKRIGEVFGGRYLWHAGTEWLEGLREGPGALERTLDHVEKLNLRDFLLPKNWEQEKNRVYNAYGIRPTPVHGVRGPVTLACSLIGAEELIFLIMDAPELADRFAAAIADTIIGIARLMDGEAGTEGQRGFDFYDDNCCLLNPAMYERFGYPVLRRVFEAFSPDEGDVRFQHSDSDMGHLLPVLGRLGLNGVNFGPNVMVDEIRRWLPKARIDGCIAPFTLMNNDPGAILDEVKRDCALARQNGRGLNVTTAGSVNNGSLLASMRVVMHAIQQYGRYH
jgi:uroporphyrinogen decarboxylase